MRRFFSGWVALCFALSAIIAPAAAQTGVHMESFTLKNGLEVIVIPNHRIPAVSHMIWYRVGAADDPPGKSGLAHFVEHMMFQGSPGLKPGEFATTVERLGGQNNAFTSSDITAYYVNIAKERLPRILDMEAARMRGITADKALTLKEREVIREERRIRIDNNPHALLNEQMKNASFQHHPYRIPTIGWPSEMEALTAEDVRDFHHRYYTPGNAVLVMSGDIIAKEARPLVEKAFGAIPAGINPERNWAAEPPAIADRTVTLRHHNVEQSAWIREYTLPSVQHGDEAQVIPLSVLAQIIGGGRLGRLYEALVVKQKIASQISAEYNGFVLGPGTLEITVIPAPDVPFERIEKAVEDVLAQVASAPVNAEEISRAKTLLKAETFYARDGLQGMAAMVGMVRMLGLDAAYINEWSSKVDAVTAEAVQEAARLVQKTHHTTGMLLPETAAKSKPVASVAPMMQEDRNVH